VIAESLRQRREAICIAHMTSENAHDFRRCIGAFKHPRYEVVPTNEIYDGDAEVDRLLTENKLAFPDFHFDLERLHHADEAILVEGTFQGTQHGEWRGLPATGRKVEVPMLIIFRFEGEAMICERVFFNLGTVLQQLGIARDPNSIGGKIAALLNHPLTFSRAVVRNFVPRRNR
jgi:predicted ester cyclase